ncbi:bactofilin family protein [Salinispira pacifica]|uniref:Integral membrane protein CcmA involved in cell shape determination n=1 Tax=Salinispira pacifica TaxID=1307761 RepID=V5WHX0_9SPIO|nr:polymer-forming cytoskeletal protein [Salinispira pacifica]AHC14766.1 hypothetical protein L21SP2_1367 [Salinispira pacifica]
MERFPEEQYVNSLIGFGSRFKGDIEIDGLFRIDGDFSGSVKTEGKVLIGSRGRADCSINARVVVIGGIFRGTVYAQEKIIVLASAVVIGNLYTPRLIAEEGVLINGSLVVTGKKAGRKNVVQPRSNGLDSSEGSDSPGKEQTRGIEAARPGGLFRIGRKRRQPSASEENTGSRTS